MYFLSTLPIMARHYRIRSAKDLILILILIIAADRKSTRLNSSHIL